MKNRRNAVVVTLLFITLIGLAITFQQNAQEKDKKEADNPTIIKIGEMNEKQRKNSKLYNDFSSKKLNLAEKNTSLVKSPPLLVDISEPALYLSQENYLPKEVCKSDVIIIGTINSKTSQLSEDFSFVFTDYEVKVKDLLKNNTSANIQSGDFVTITRAGGMVKLNNHIIRALDKAYKPLEIEKDYMLFLNYLSESDSYNAVGYDSTYEIQENKIKKVKNQEVFYKKEDGDLNELKSQISELSLRCSGEVNR